MNIETIKANLKNYLEQARFDWRAPEGFEECSFSFYHEGQLKVQIWVYPKRVFVADDQGRFEDWTARPNLSSYVLDARDRQKEQVEARILEAKKNLPETRPVYGMPNNYCRYGF